jgi:hypothetical protein
MNKPMPLLPFVQLGYDLAKLYNPYNMTYKDFVAYAKEFAIRVQNLSFSRVTGQIAQFIIDLEKAYADNPDQFLEDSKFGLYGSTGEYHLTYEYRTRFNEIIHKFQQSLINSGQKWEFVWIDRSVVSNTLRSLHEKAIDEHQQLLIAEATRCLECGANRSAIVIGWNICLDHLRQWIFSSKRGRLKDLNAALVARKEKPISQFTDFFELREKDLIDAAYTAKLLKKNTHKHLLGALYAPGGSRN